MPVDSKSLSYLERAAIWTKIMDILDGEARIKEQGTDYLPKLSGQTDPEYAAYKARGTFFNAFDRTVNGLTGAVMRRAPVVEVPTNVEVLLEDCTLAGLSFNDVVRTVIFNIISYGYYGVLVDMPEVPILGKPPRPYVALYKAANILNWRTVKEGDQDKLVLLVLREEEMFPSADDPFEMVTQEQMRVLAIEEGNLVVRIWRKTTVGAKEEWGMVVQADGGTDIFPKNKGANLDYIPFVFFGTINNEPAPPKPPLTDLANLNIKHWQVTADYFHGLHWCALPTPYFLGVEKKKGEALTIGPSKALTSTNANAKVGILEFTGQGLGSVEKALDRLEAQMAVMGARLLEHKKMGVESADALRLRSADEVGTLITIVGSAENGLTNVLKFMAVWVGGDEEKVSLGINRDFITSRLSAQDIAVLLQSVQAGKISLETFLWNLKTGEILPADRTIEDEKETIKAEGAEEFGSRGEEEEE